MLIKQTFASVWITPLSRSSSSSKLFCWEEEPAVDDVAIAEDVALGDVPAFGVISIESSFRFLKEMMSL